MVHPRHIAIQISEYFQGRMYGHSWYRARVIQTGIARDGDIATGGMQILQVKLRIFKQAVQEGTPRLLVIIVDNQNTDLNPVGYDDRADTFDRFSDMCAAKSANQDIYSHDDPPCAILPRNGFERVIPHRNGGL